MARIIELLEDRSAYVRRTALEVVAKHTVVAARRQIRQLLEDSEPSSRRAALAALNATWTPNDFQVVAKMELIDGSPDVRKDAAAVLLEHADARSWSILYSRWRTASLGRHRRWAVELAGLFGGADLLAELDAAANDRDGHVRRAAIRAKATILNRGLPVHDEGSTQNEE